MNKLSLADGVLAFRESGSGEPVLLMHSGFIADSMLPLLSEPSLQKFSSDQLSPPRLR